MGVVHGPDPAIVALVQGEVRNQRLGHPALAQLRPDAKGAVAPAPSRLQVLAGEALVTQQALALEPIEQRLDFIRVGAPAQQLSLELGPRMLTGSQQTQRGLSEPCIPVAAQASTSASCALSSPAAWGRAAARICASISAAMPGLSLRKLRALSLPWPMRSPL